MTRLNIYVFSICAEYVHLGEDLLKVETVRPLFYHRIDTAEFQ